MTWRYMASEIFAPQNILKCFTWESWMKCIYNRTGAVGHASQANAWPYFKSYATLKNWSDLLLYHYWNRFMKSTNILYNYLYLHEIPSNSNQQLTNFMSSCKQTVFILWELNSFGSILQYGILDWSTWVVYVSWENSLTNL